MQMSTDKLWMEIRDHYGRVRGKIDGPQRDRTYPRGRPTESTNLDPWKLPETEPPTKEQIQAGPWPWHIYSRGLPLLASVGEDVSNPVETWCPRVGGYGGGALSEAKRRGRGRNSTRGQPGGVNK